METRRRRCPKEVADIASGAFDEQQETKTFSAYECIIENISSFSLSLPSCFSLIGGISIPSFFSLMLKS